MPAMIPMIVYSVPLTASKPCSSPGVMTSLVKISRKMDELMPATAVTAMQQMTKMSCHL